jgi:hypothetical protein
MKKPHPAFFQPAFVVCAILLAVSAGTKSVVIQTLGVQLTKLPIPLKKPLDQMDGKKLVSYEVRDKQTITNRDILESLGTEQYLQWTLEDKAAAAESPTRYCSLFITYYTGNPDMVPHVPDECYVGGGNIRLKGETLTVEVPWPGREKPVSIAMQQVWFGRKVQSILDTENQFSVQYFFKANDEFCGSRTETRTVLGKNFFGKYSYFAKVEWKFFGTGYAGLIYPTREQTLEASQKLLSVLLPILEEDHWPDWKTANQKTGK